MRRSYYARKPVQPLVNYKINHQITALEVRVIGEHGENVGVITLAQALKTAGEKGLDVIEVSPKAQPPVVRFGRYGSFKYEQEKRIKQQKAKQKTVEVKGVRLSFRIGAHDLEVRKKQAQRFLADKNKVRIELPLSGRERQFKDKAKDMVREFAKSLGDNIITEGNMEWQFGKLTAIIYQKV